MRETISLLYYGKAVKGEIKMAKKQQGDFSEMQISERTVTD